MIYLSQGLKSFTCIIICREATCIFHQLCFQRASSGEQLMNNIVLSENTSNINKVSALIDWPQALGQVLIPAYMALASSVRSRLGSRHRFLLCAWMEYLKGVTSHSHIRADSAVLVLYLTRIMVIHLTYRHSTSNLGE